jgi:Ca2+/Na+ antiporter
VEAGGHKEYILICLIFKNTSKIFNFLGLDLLESLLFLGKRSKGYVIVNQKITFVFAFMFAVTFAFTLLLFALTSKRSKEIELTFLVSI